MITFAELEIGEYFYIVEGASDKYVKVSDTEARHVKLDFITEFDLQHAVHKA